MHMHFVVLNKKQNFRVIKENFYSKVLIELSKSYNDVISVFFLMKSFIKYYVCVVFIVRNLMTHDSKLSKVKK